jgi:hypothetical protein
MCAFAPRLGGGAFLLFPYSSDRLTIHNWTAFCEISAYSSEISAYSSEICAFQTVLILIQFNEYITWKMRPSLRSFDVRFIPFRISSGGVGNYQILSDGNSRTMLGSSNLEVGQKYAFQCFLPCKKLPGLN